MQFSIGII